MKKIKLSSMAIATLKALGVKKFDEDNYYQILNFLLVSIKRVQEDPEECDDGKNLKISMLESVIKEISATEELDFKRINEELAE